jgi:hypothetical protein
MSNGEVFDANAGGDLIMDYSVSHRGNNSQTNDSKSFHDLRSCLTHELSCAAAQPRNPTHNIPRQLQRSLDCPFKWLAGQQSRPRLAPPRVFHCSVVGASAWRDTKSLSREFRASPGATTSAERGSWRTMLAKP